MQKPHFCFFEEKYSEAYENALALQVKLTGHEEYQRLDAMNTLRLLFLAEKLGDAPQKALAWSKLQKHPAYPLIEPLFQEGALSWQTIPTDYDGTRS